MAHFAKIVNGTVTRVIVADQEFMDTFVDDSPGEWIQASYNTSGGVHSDGGTPLRKNFPSTEWLYDGTGFCPPKPFDSWTLNNTTYLWEPPVAHPDSGKHTWNEETTSWDAVE
jgi:hypothetical protein